MATKTKRAHDLIDQIEADARKQTVRDILIDLEDSLKQCEFGEGEGIQAAIEIIKANY